MKEALERLMGGLQRELRYQHDRITLYKENNLDQEWLFKIMTIVSAIDSHIENIHEDCSDEDDIDRLKERISSLEYQIDNKPSGIPETRCEAV